MYIHLFFTSLIGRSTLLTINPSLLTDAISTNETSVSGEISLTSDFEILI